LPLQRYENLLNRQGGLLLQRYKKFKSVVDRQKVYCSSDMKICSTRKEIYYSSDTKNS